MWNAVERARFRAPARRPCHGSCCRECCSIQLLADRSARGSAGGTFPRIIKQNPRDDARPIKAHVRGIGQEKSPSWIVPRSSRREGSTLCRGRMADSRAKRRLGRAIPPGMRRENRMPVKGRGWAMKNLGRQAAIWLSILAGLWVAGCGGGGSGTPPPPSKGTPIVTVTPASQGITTVQSLQVTVTVTGSNGTPTGSVTLTSGTYTSSAVTLTGGSASITIPAGTLPAGTDALSAAYTPDAASSSTYNSASGGGQVTVTKVTPTVTVTPAFSSITTIQNLSVTVAVSGGPVTRHRPAR